jgi:hypothetical protein
MSDLHEKSASGGLNQSAWNRDKWGSASSMRHAIGFTLGEYSS